MSLPEPFFSAGSLKYAAGTSGGEYAGPCPWCGGVDRFRCWPRHPGAEGRGGRYLCRQCGRHGDGIDFLRELHGLSYREACERLGVQPQPIRTALIHKSTMPPWEPAPLIVPGDGWHTAARAFLRDLPLALEYGRERGLIPETVKALGLRWNDRDQYFPRAAWGLPEEIRPETGRPKKVWVPRGMAIPNLRDGRGVGLKIRRADPGGEAKYIQVSGSAKASFILPGIKLGLPLVVVESELDAALIWQEGRDLVTTLALGTARGKPDAGAVVLLRAASVILVALDFDQAGAEAWPWWRTHFLKARRWPTPCEKDIGDFFKAGGDIHEWIVVGLSRSLLAGDHVIVTRLREVGQALLV